MTKTSKAEPAPAGAPHVSVGVARTGQVSARHASLLELQRSIGNSAFSALVAPSVPVAGVTVQRDLLGDIDPYLPRAKSKGTATGTKPAVDPAKISAKQGTTIILLLAMASPGDRTAAINTLGRPVIEKCLDRTPSSKRFGKGFGNILLSMPDPWFAAYLAKLPKGEGLSKTEKTLLQGLFAACPNDRLADLKTLMSIRFDMAIGGATTAAAAGETAIDWEPLGLRRMYSVLEALPPAHVAGNAKQLSMGRYQGTGVSGYYWRNESAIGYDTAGLSDKQESTGDPLHGVNRFDKVVRHEVGHAVDAQMGWAGNYSAATDNGGWHPYDANYSAVFDAMLADASGPIKALKATEQADVKAALEWVMANRAPAKVSTRLKRLTWFKALKTKKRDALIADPMVEAVVTGLKSPWYNASATGGVLIGSYIYQESYANQWVRYIQAARSKKVSQYQFRAPGEWFAEAYAAYYEPAKTKGALLASKDPTTKKWFDKNVDKLKASR